MRKAPLPVNEKIKQLETLITGWVNYFRLTQGRSIMRLAIEFMWLYKRVELSIRIYTFFLPIRFEFGDNRTMSINLTA
jgi:hypothetical protein